MIEVVWDPHVERYWFIVGYLVFGSWTEANYWVRARRRTRSLRYEGKFTV